MGKGPRTLQEIAESIIQLISSVALSDQPKTRWPHRAIWEYGLHDVYHSRAEGELEANGNVGASRIGKLFVFIIRWPKYK